MAPKQINLLVVDWDQFFTCPFGDPEYEGIDEMFYDWGHMESMFFIHGVWTTRAHGFLMNDMPLPGLTGLQDTFWQRFTFAKDTELLWGESNSIAASVEVTGTKRQRTFNEVWLYDAHHDSGYRGEDPLQKLRASSWGCEDWMVLYFGIGAVLHMRYPTWRAWAMTGEPKPIVPVDRQVDDGQPNPRIFNRVVVCRSGAWVPPWAGMDEQFQAFVDAAPVKTKRCLDEDGCPPREWNQVQAEAESAAHREYLLGIGARGPAGIIPDAELGEALARLEKMA